jgi:hypothetical protein
VDNGGVHRCADGVVVAGDQLEVWNPTAIANCLLGNLIQLQGRDPWPDRGSDVSESFLS